MKTFVVTLGLMLSLAASAANPPMPKYNLASGEVYGEYEELTNEWCKDTEDRPCVAGEVNKENGQVVLYLVDFDRTIPLKPTAAGRLVFKWENPKDDDCDDPGCWNLLGLSGVIYPKLKAGKWVPALKVFARKDYPFPDEEGAPEGEVTEIYKYNKR